MIAVLSVFNDGSYCYPLRRVNLGKFSDHVSAARAAMDHLYDPGVAGYTVLLDLGSDVYSIWFHAGNMMLTSIYTDSEIVLSRGSGFTLWF